METIASSAHAEIALNQITTLPAKKTD